MMENNEMKEEAFSTRPLSTDNVNENEPEALSEISSPIEHAEIEIEQLENYQSFSKEELTKTLEKFLADADYSGIKSKVIHLKDAFNGLISHERQIQLEKYLENGGEKESFEYKTDEYETRFNAALKKINRRRIEFLESQEKQKEINFTAKQEILKQLKDLIQNEENMAKAFNTFHDLQNKWRAIGAVPGKNADGLWMTYRLYNAKFYDLIKINRELQDLDQKKNLEIKMRLCEQAEDLISEPSLNKALNKMQVLQNNWKEVGYVPRDKRAEIGERFKSASDKVLARRKEYLEQLKLKQDENLKEKINLCEKIEQITISDQPTHKEFQDKTKQLLELQAEYRKVGYAERTANDEVWKRFKSCADNFFKQKQDFYQAKKKEYQANLHAKTELCVQAEAMMNSTDWRNTTAEFKKLNEEWKKIGPVGIKMSDKIWHRFKAACDTFFQNKKEHYAGVEKEFEENYSKKINLLNRIEQYKHSEDREDNFNALKNFQREWTEIGLVPHDKKDELYVSYKKLIDNLFNGLRLDEKEKREIHYKGKIDFLKNTAHSKEKISDEKRALMNKISQLNNDVVVWENNLGFFAKSKNADQIKTEFETKINKAKEEITELKKQLQVIKTFSPELETRSKR